MDEQLSTTLRWTPGLRSRWGHPRMTRPWQRTGGWSPHQAAAELHRRRPALIGQLGRRAESRGVPRGAQEEIVDDAITAVVMAPRGVANEHHLIGAFWLAVDHRCRRYREGRHLTRLGSRRRVDFDQAAQRLADGANPFDALELRDRFARAGDLIADLDPRERQVFTVMASKGVGPVPAARLLDLTLGEARSAARSANMKLDRIAAISAAGRMCEFRADAIVADASGAASEHQARLARAHVSACVPCGRVYRELRREMRGREFQRAAVAAFLPLPAMTPGHIGVPASSRSGSNKGSASCPAAAQTAPPRRSAARARQGRRRGHRDRGLRRRRHRPPRPLDRRHTPQAHHRAHLTRQLRAATLAGEAYTSLAAGTLSSSTQNRAPQQRRSHLPRTPSRSLSYLALGSSGSGLKAADGTSRASASIASATGSSARSESASSAETAAPPPSESHASSTPSGGGTSLGYLGP